MVFPARALLSALSAALLAAAAAAGGAASAAAYVDACGSMQADDGSSTRILRVVIDDAGAGRHVRCRQARRVLRHALTHSNADRARQITWACPAGWDSFEGAQIVVGCVRWADGATVTARPGRPAAASP